MRLFVLLILHPILQFYDESQQDSQAEELEAIRNIYTKFESTCLEQRTAAQYFGAQQVADILKRLLTTNSFLKA